MCSRANFHLFYRDLSRSLAFRLPVSFRHVLRAGVRITVRKQYTRRVYSPDHEDFLPEEPANWFGKVSHDCRRWASWLRVCNGDKADQCFEL